MNWDPQTYEAFTKQRERPFFDLLCHIRHPHAHTVIDAGCGTGRTTQQLAQAFPTARVVGVDSSREMLEHAKSDAAARASATGTSQAPGGTTDAGGPAPTDRIAFQHGDLRTWRPARQADVVVSNAVLHWIPGPEAMVGRMASWIAPGGLLAFQVPANFDQPSHRLVRQSAAEEPRLAEVPMGDHILELEQYARILEEEGFAVDAWETTYRMRLAPGGVLQWLEGTTLRPHIEALGSHAADWLAALGARLDEAYPPDGRGVVFPFTRRFVVARCAGSRAHGDATDLQSGLVGLGDRPPLG